MTGDEWLKARLAETAWRCGTTVVESMAVAFVIRNRVAQGESWPVAWESQEFLARIETTRRRDGWPDIRDPEFVQILHAVDGVFDGRLQDKMTNGALNAYSINTGIQLKPEEQRVAVVGQLMLCR